MKWKRDPVERALLGDRPVGDAVGDEGKKSLSTASRDFYNQVYREYSEAVLRFFRRRGYTPEEAQDGLQDVYLRVIRLSQPAQLAESPKAYLLKVATNLVRDRYRKSGAVKLVPQDTLDLEGVPALAPSPERQLQTRQQIATVREAVLQLSDKQREIFLMHRLDGMTCREISAALHIPLRTVERRLSDALAYCLVRLEKAHGAKP